MTGLIYLGPLNLAPPGILQAQQQGIFSPPSTGITRSPVQILGVLHVSSSSISVSILV